MITDAQVHLWEPDRPERPWPHKPQRAPHRSNGFKAEEMLAEMDAAGVDRAVVIPPHWVGDHNETALEAAAKYPTRFAVVGRLNFTAPDAQAQLESWLKQPHMVGVRATFHTKPYSDWLEDGSLDWFWKNCERAGIPVVALAPGNARKFLPVLERYSNLKIVIPHMGCTLDSHVPESFASLDDVLSLVRFPHVYVMTSSAPCFSNESFPFRDVAPFIKRLYDVFGPRRLFWGADFTRLPCSYRECLDQFRTSLDFLSAEDKGWILGRALAEALPWPERAA